jgi:rhamnosyltransferase
LNESASICDPKRTTVGVAIPTLNAGNGWQKCLAAVKSQSCTPQRMLIIDSASTDQTVELAQTAGFELLHIARSEFNHGGTRQRAVEYLDDCDIIVFLTQDAILAHADSLSEIITQFDDPMVAVAYGRQLPHQGAKPIEAHARIFNYGPQSTRKDTAAAARLGAKVFFCSNSFAAYRRSLLLTLGGFRNDLILGEDMEYAARAVNAGYVNMYCATAAVLHSHDYAFTQSVARYFDLGVFYAENFHMQQQFGSYGGEGARFLRSELTYLAHRSPFSIPRALILTAAKLLGYRLGRMHRVLPTALKRRLSQYPSYWSTSG